MTRSDSPSRLEALKRVRDEERAVIALRDHAPALFGPGASLAGVTGWRLYPLRGGGYAVEYQVDLITADGPCTESVFALLEDVNEGEVTSLGVPIDELGIRVFRPADDPRLSRLEPALDGDGVKELEGRGRLVAYRPLARAAIRFDLSDGGSRYLRISASKTRFERICDLALFAGGLACEGSYGRVFPRVVAVSPRLRGVIIEGVPGRNLHECIATADESWMVETARTVAALHREPKERPALHSAVDEAEATSWMVRRGGLAMPEALRPAERQLARLFEAAAFVATNGFTSIHRDLHDKQIIRHEGGSVVLLDTDTLSFGDPALDVANLVAHIRLRALFDRCSEAIAERLVGAFLTEYERRRGTLAWRNFQYYSACTWLRLVGVYALRSHGRPVVGEALDRAAACLDQLTHSGRMPVHTYVPPRDETEVRDSAASDLQQRPNPAGQEES